MTESPSNRSFNLSSGLERSERLASANTGNNTGAKMSAGNQTRKLNTWDDDNLPEWYV